MDDVLSRSSVGQTRGQPRQTAAAGRGRVSLWKRLALLYRLFLRADEIGLKVEGAPPQRRREVAFGYWWRGQNE